jgi:ketosteroid isomerase-like protein
MLGWLVSKMIRHNVNKTNGGDIGPTLNTYAQDGVLRFPGDHSWGGEYRGRARIKEFLDRCVQVGLQFEIEDVVVAGWPWSMKVCIRLTDVARDADRAVVYENRAVIFANAAWGKISAAEVYEDTQAVAAFDRYLETRQPAAA